MEYDYRTRTYDSQTASYSRSGAATSSPTGPPLYGGQPAPLYPKIGGASSQSQPSAGRNPPFHHAPAAPSNSGVGIRVAIKREYRITPPPQLLSQLGDIPRSNFHFDFEFERNVLTEVVKENPNWSGLGIENVVPKPTEPASSFGSTADPIVSKYIAAGLNREAVPIAVANYGDNPTKVKEFVEGFNLLREMGFSSNNVAEGLLMYDNDTNKALAYFLNNTS